MSYILDALKKAEQERDRGRVPRLASVQEAAPRSVRALPWLIAALLLLNAAALAWWLRPSAPPAVTRPVPQTPSLGLRHVVPLPRAVPPVVRPSAPPQVAPPIVPAPIPPRPRPAPVKIPVTKPVTPPPAPKPAENDVPRLRDLPADARAAVPPLNLDVHVYAPNAADRFVLINMRKYHEGEQLAEGPRIEAITETGVLLSYQGQRFRIERP